MPVEDIRQTFGLGAIDQISFAVRDLKQALAPYEALFGPFTSREVHLSDGVTYRGQPANVALKLAHAFSGGVQIELVEVVSGGFPQVEHLKKYGPGLQHVKFPVKDLEGKRKLMESHGYATLVLGQSGATRFSYLEAPPELGYSVIELIQRG